MPLHVHDTTNATDPVQVRPQFAQLGEITEVPKLQLAAAGMPEGTAYEIVHDELMLDGNARLNLATFVTTWMEPDAEQLMAECSAKNMIDKDEYPQTAELERRCVNILAHLWHAPDEGGSHGMLDDGLERGLHAGRPGAQVALAPASPGGGQVRPTAPNLVMGANVQVCWEKFCRYWDVEARLVPVGARRHLSDGARAAVAHCDENTIGVVAVMGSTYDGVYEPVAEIAAALDDLAGVERRRRPDPRRRGVGGIRRPVPRSRPRSGTSGSPGSSRSTPRATSTGSCIPGWAGSSGVTRPALPDELVFNVELPRRRRCPRSPSTSHGPERRSWRSTTTSSASAPTDSAGTAGLPRHRAMARPRDRHPGTYAARLGRRRHPCLRLPDQ